MAQYATHLQVHFMNCISGIHLTRKLNSTFEILVGSCDSSKGFREIKVLMEEQAMQFEIRMFI